MTLLGVESTGICNDYRNQLVEILIALNWLVTPARLARIGKPQVKKILASNLRNLPTYSQYVADLLEKNPEFTKTTWDELVNDRTRDSITSLDKLAGEVRAFANMVESLDQAALTSKIETMYRLIFGEIKGKENFTKDRGSREP